MCPRFPSSRRYREPGREGRKNKKKTLGVTKSGKAVVRDATHKRHRGHQALLTATLAIHPCVCVCMCRGQVEMKSANPPQYIRCVLLSAGLSRWVNRLAAAHVCICTNTLVGSMSSLGGPRVPQGCSTDISVLITHHSKMPSVSPEPVGIIPPAESAGFQKKYFPKSMI